MLSTTRLLAHDRELRRAALVPTVGTLVGCVVVALFASALADEGDAVHSFLVTFAAVISLPPTLLYPLWVRLAQRARTAFGAGPGDSEFTGRSYLRMLWEEGQRALRQMLVVGTGLLPVAVLVEAIAPQGRWFSLALVAAWSFYWVVIDALELPIELAPGKLGAGEPTWFERSFLAVGGAFWPLRPLAWAGRWVGRLARPWRHAVRFTELNALETLGFSLAVGLVLIVPVAGAFVRAVAIVAATGLVVTAEGAVAPSDLSGSTGAAAPP